LDPYLLNWLHVFDSRVGEDGVDTLALTLLDDVFVVVQASDLQGAEGAEEGFGLIG
jgi:hypothetical protein